MESISNGPARILQTADYKKRVRQMWDTRAKRYDASDMFHERLANKLVEFAHAQPGQHVMDIATGTGMVALPIAAQVGPAGRVTGIDISSNMAEEAKRKAAAAQISQVEFVQADAELLEVPLRSLDLITCSSGMLYLQNIDTALERFASWLKPGGSLCFNTPQEPCVPATTVFYDLLAETTGLRLADAAQPLATAEIVADKLRGSGFQDAQVETSPEVIQFRGLDAEQYAEQIWRSLTVNAIMTPLEEVVPLEELEVFKPQYLNEVKALAKGWANSEGLANPYTMLWARGTV